MYGIRLQLSSVPHSTGDEPDFGVTLIYGYDISKLIMPLKIKQWIIMKT